MENTWPIVLTTVLCVCAVMVSSQELESPNQSRPRRNILQTVWMLSCISEKSAFDYADYGCYCGPGGEGTPVDDLDRCCKVHDECYGTAEDNCFLLFEYLGTYDYKCEDGKITCVIGDEANLSCREFLCECDRKVSECLRNFESKYNPDNFGIAKTKCKG